MDQKIEIGPLSGKASVAFWLEKRGIEPSDELVDKVFARAKRADRVLTEAELLKLCAQPAPKGGKAKFKTRGSQKRAARRRVAI
jgi:isopropylmalate/homocitrate/citramalate synthase